MKLNKKLIAIIVAVVLIVACCAFSVSATEAESHGCEHYLGIATEVVEHWLYGGSCEAHVRTYCPLCGTVFDDYVGIWSPCPHDDYN